MAPNTGVKRSVLGEYLTLLSYLMNNPRINIDDKMLIVYDEKNEYQVQANLETKIVNVIVFYPEVMVLDEDCGDELIGQVIKHTRKLIGGIRV